MQPTIRLFTVIAGSALLSACGHHDHRPPPPPPPPIAGGSLSRTFDMIDQTGVRYGTVEMDPVGGGRVIDTTGRMIGRIVPPEPPPRY